MSLLALPIASFHFCCLSHINFGSNLHTGTITVDGVDLKSLDPRYIRRHVALVAQEPVLFAMSVAQNIAYGYAAARGNPDATPTRAEVQVHGCWCWW